MVRRQRVLVTGRPGAGKTTAIRHVAAALLERSVPVAGFLTEEVRGSGERVGFDLVPFQGRRCAMARKGSPGPARVGRYGVDVDAVDRVAQEAMEHCERAPSDAVVVIDEVGKMELFSQDFIALVEGVLAGPWRSVLSVTQAPVPFARRLLERDDVRVLTVSKEDREDAPARILSALGF